MKLHFSQNTKYNKIYKNTYWGNFVLDESNKIEDFAEIFENRNDFITKYHIKDVAAETKFVGDYLRKLKKISLNLDHIEIYKTNDNNYLILNSPYYDGEIEGFEKIYNLYNKEANSYMQIISKEEMKYRTKEKI